MAITETASAKPKFRRASGPKSRLGCITCKSRHLKCDEEHPFCRRCHDDKVRCDGYAMPKPKKQRRGRQPKTHAVQPVAQSITILPTVNDFPSLTDVEQLYFQHFLQWTSKQLSVSPASKNFWLRYALPMAHHSEPIRYSMIAVGASHRLFMARSIGFSHPWELKRLAIYQYNKAITSILPTMAAKSTLSIHRTLVCCLLFVSFEALAGRYGELFRHLRAGNQLFHDIHDTPVLSSTLEERVVTEKLIEMFCRLGVESSNFMDEHSLSGVSKWYRNNHLPKVSSNLPFKDLDEASYELRKLDLQQDDKPWDAEREVEPEGNYGKEEEPSSLGDALRQWTSRFEAFTQLQGTHLSTEAGSQLQNLRLRQRFWQMTVEAFSSEDALSNPETFSPFMTMAESVAVPFTTTNQSTFSLDGDLISGLSFVMSITRDDDIKSRALNLLRNLNRREGIWDSRDVVKMHELIMSVGESDSEPEECDLWCVREAPAGIPGIIEQLQRR
ncbi:hypothetical protein LCI18_007023 [Fusarium solani-melongenae]|uniref:Uncharacterized protein n=1 Tax=Fusarium solani subsp. cucurbitae TaxID=2747967 RepID=A0ACD3Z4S8_FUSSC|nr:hypothetical protein LCI18_007023 [Fusarium solani-melongenae]